MSPQKKKAKLLCRQEGPTKRLITEENESNLKRLKSDSCNIGEDFKALKRKNFIKACEQVSYKAYHNFAKRLKLIYLPSCINGNKCDHQNVKEGNIIKQVPSYVEESFKIEMKTNMWLEALEVCFLCITPTQYLSANILKNVVEIMLNAHEDPDADCDVSYILEKCQQILSHNFSLHPPCLGKTIRKCYTNFLTSPMDVKDNTFSNRVQFECKNGIVKYCMNRLEYELSSDSKDEALVDKYDNIPEEMKESVKGLHWQKEKFEIYEALKRSDRIKRLMMVLESIIELLQFDLAIWNSRYTNNMGCHIMRSHRPLMTFILWSDNVLYTGAVNNNCRQILRIFTYMVHLQYPEEYIRIISVWLNAMVHTFYICENNSNSDYPNTGKYCKAFAKEFYKIITELPKESIPKILQKIQPSYMKYLVGSLHVHSIISASENNIIQIIMNFINNKEWEQYPAIHNKLDISATNMIKARRVKNITKYLSKTMNKIMQRQHSISKTNESCRKFMPIANKDSFTIDQNYVIFCLYIALDAYLEAFNVQHVQDMLDTLNKKMLHNEQIEEDFIPQYCTYSVTLQFIKQYRSIYEQLQELIIRLHKLAGNGHLPEAFKIFENVGLLGL
ncbi:uncharacterized protein [Battus philenor]|uniref:uncharacterized protein n=1 Tax=Battus philenor TaxID=42288 RepID=UPI0035D06064